MKHPRQTLLIAIGSILTAAMLLGQSGTSWTTASDIRDGIRGRMIGTVRSIIGTSRFEIVPDSDRSYGAVTVNSDSLVTQYMGFSDASTSSDTLTGPAGFSRLREGDRVDVRGVGSSNRSIAAEQVTLLGRPLGSSAVRSATSRSVEGVVRQVSIGENRLTLETDSRQLVTITGTSSTPVLYRGETTYKISNIEVGDRIRVETESTSSSGTVRARSIEVVTSVQDTGPADRRRVTTIYGKITAIDTRAQTMRIDTNRERGVRIDVRAATTDDMGRRLRLSDLRVGDRVEVTGDYDSAGVFRASTIRMDDGTANRVPEADDVRDDRADELELRDYVTVTLYGTVAESLSDSGVLVLKETNRNTRILVDGDLVVKTKSGTYVTADSLKVADRIAVKAFRDKDDRHIAQTIRYR